MMLSVLNLALTPSSHRGIEGLEITIFGKLTLKKNEPLKNGVVFLPRQGERKVNVSCLWLTTVQNRKKVSFDFFCNL